ncbi:uncharacterized protein LOC116298146 [Actinia tenebrosa]|uniref:Uncharacterized protein LOC116298146 n=1 Tax=Actinia tenebrosa TaxID=6105 RepID=A0A6P8I1D0_ACTTE|nr:uncharacterized protein LOC116298146 [Actinia tenebrosa]
MRAQCDKSRVEQVRNKVAKLKRNLLIAENKLREARESLLASSDERLKKTLGFRWRYERQVKSRSLVTEVIPVLAPPCRNIAVQRFHDRLGFRNIAYASTKPSAGDRCSMHHSVVTDRCKTIVKKELSNSSEPSNKPRSIANSGYHLRRMTSKVCAARNKSSNFQIKFKTLRERLHYLEAKILKTKSRVEIADSLIKVLKERLSFLGERVKAHEVNRRYRRESMQKISDLENRITIALNKAIEVENLEGVLETRVLEIEDSIEVYNMKIQRAQDVLHRLNQGKIPANTCTVTMVFRRISLSSQFSFKPPLPVLLQATYCEESD